MVGQLALDAYAGALPRKHKMLNQIVICFGLFLSTVLYVSEGHAQATSEPSLFLLGPGDRISLRVIQWREEDREFKLLDAVGGVYSVQTDGTVEVALGGAFMAGGQTTTQLSDAIATEMKLRLRTIERPSVIVDVVEFSPFYIIGDVERPGAIQTTPGLTAIQAFALAGGAPRFRSGGFRDATVGLRDTGNLSQTRLDLLRASIASVRLVAESNGFDTLDFPEDLRHPQGNDVLAVLFEEERQIFQARRTALAREQSTLEELIALSQTEVTSLQTKITGFRTQTIFAQENLENITALVERGLARSPQLSTAQRELFDLETKELDLQSSIFRAQQSIKEAERDLVGLNSNRATMAAVELQDVNAKIEALRVRRDMLRSLVLEHGTATSGEEGDEVLVFNFDVQRGSGEMPQTLSGPDTVLARGDILTVTQTFQNVSARP